MSENTGHVTVMRSYDYSHFEFSLPLPEGDIKDAEHLKAIDGYRKIAAKLCDKAVKQYRISKANAEKILSEQQSRRILVARMEHVASIPEGERTVNQQAELKAYNDEPYKERPYYDYQDDWRDDDDE